MAGEINSTNVVIQNGTGEIVGQGSGTLTWANNLIITSNKSNGDAVTAMDGEGSGKQLTYACEFVWNTEAQFQKAHTDSISNTADTYTLTLPSVGNTTDESFVASMIPTGLTLNAAHGESLKTSLTFTSIGAVTHTPYVA
tara:strand:+ start:69 stop:488 length:420 start_codon:yes stop_codon:yes gene_type:complete